jgi:flagellar basal-body rod protein FlgG
MLRSLSTAATGMDAQQTKLDVTANNIANVSTPGFKKSRAEFEDLMYQTVMQPGTSTGANTQTPTGLQIGMGVRVVDTQREHSEGDLQQTGNQLDLAIQGNGFFGVTLPSGQLAYTRNGSMKMDATGKLVTSDGYALTSSITIPPDATSVTIGVDGTVTAAVATSAQPVQVGQIQLVNFPNPAGLASMGANMYSETGSSGTATTGTPGQNGIGTLQQGSLEGSNVSVVTEMVDLIAGQRAYDVNSRVIKAADEMMQETAQLR